MIVTSYVFREGKFDLGRLRAMSWEVGKDRLVVDIRWVYHKSQWVLG